jgi:hypothetical protein
LETVTDTAAAVAVFPDVSVATAEILCVPLATDEEFHESEYGDAVTAEPVFVPSTVNRTLATATLSDAFAESVTVPDTVAPLAGAVIDTVGGVLSVVFVVPNVAVPLVAVVPEAVEVTAK